MAMYPCLSLPSLSFPSVSGAVCSFDSQYAGLPLKSHKIALTATQSGSGTPSPSNPRPISGYNAINISHSDADTSNPTVYTINLGGTYYGGEYDARTGVLTVTHKAVDLGTLSWSGQPSNEFTANVPDMKMKGSLLCSIYSQTNAARVELMPDYSMWNMGWAFTPRNLVLKDTRYADSASFKTAMNGIICVYELETPTQTIQLPPCPIDTLEGVNNIWADTGDTTLQYIKLG